MSAVLAQVTGPISGVPIAWAEISPELVLFGAGLLVLILETAGRDRAKASFVAMGVLVATGGFMRSASATLLLPAGLLALGGVAQFALTLIWRDRPKLLAAILTAVGFAAAIGVTAWQWATYAGTLMNEEGQPFVGTASLIGDMVAVDGVALFTRVTVCLAGLVTIPLSYSYLQERRIHRGEYYPLLLFAATGMTLLAASADLIMVFIAIEILSLALYILSGFAKRDLNSQESALKYFLLGAFSSALLLYGIALAYGVAGTTNIATVGQAFTITSTPRGMVLASMGLMLVGFGFKTALVPFHMWTPDVYQGAPTPVTGFMAAATKAAAFAAFLRVFSGAFGALSWSWMPVFSVIAVLTMVLGAVLAVVQTDLKRMLGYSAIAHAGYVLIGLMATSRDGVSSSLLYLLIYAFMSIGSFGVLALLERRSHKAMALDDLAGLGQRDPLPAALFALFLLALAGVPGTAGFIAKLAVFRAGIEAGLWPLVVVAVISSFIAAFFYIRVIVAMFMVPPLSETREPLEPTPGMTGGILVSAAAVILLGLPIVGPVVELARQAATFAA
ncbi:MAG: NADH-quinone oxidoreductase subunit N [Egibacteraceae bacterium]